jgi:hypothetical protein
MTPDGWAALADLANSITVLGLGAIIIVSLIRRIVIIRGTHEELVALLRERIEELVKERDEAIAGWKAQTEATQTLAAGVTALKSAVEKLASRRRAYDDPTDGRVSGRESG